MLQRGGSSLALRRTRCPSGIRCVTSNNSKFFFFLMNSNADYHHDMLYPSSISPKEIIERASAIWERRGIKPKQHLSEPRPGAVTLMERRAHADRCENLPPDLPDDMGAFLCSIYGLPTWEFIIRFRFDDRSMNP